MPKPPYVRTWGVIQPTEVLPPPWVIVVTMDGTDRELRYREDDPILFEAVMHLQSLMRARDYDRVSVIQA